MMSGDGGALLELRRLRKHFPIQRGVLRRTVGWIRAVDDIDLEVRAGARTNADFGGLFCCSGPRTDRVVA